MTDLILLPTARVVLPELQTEFGPIPPALVPLEGTPAFRYIAADVVGAGGQVVLGAHDNIEYLREYVDRNRDFPATIVDVGPTESLAATVLETLRNLPPGAHDRIVLNFADTYVGDLPSDGDVVCFHRQADTHRWTTFAIENNKLVAVVDKDIDKSAGEACVFVGVFAFSDVHRFVESLARHEEDFYTAITEYYNATPTTILFETSIWYDFGHIDTYYATRQQFFLNKRFFNRVTVDAKRGLIRKTSDDYQKFVNEIRWYVDLPKSLAHLAPRVFDYSTGQADAFVDMEFYGYAPLAESYLHGAWDSGVWAQAFRSLSDVADSMHSQELVLNAEERGSMLKEFYEGKTFSRSEQIVDSKLFGPLLKAEVVINGERCMGLETALELLPRVAKSSALYERNALTVMHGDLCLSNILFDRRTSIIRLIDPRGSFVDPGIYGDPLYDYAKLTHSIEGDYDQLVHGLFDVLVTEGGVFLDAHINQRQRTTKAQFREWLVGELGGDFTKVKLIEALLFISMVPLHSDKPRSQVAYLTRGLQLYSAACRRLGIWNPHAGVVVPHQQMSER